MSTNGDHEMADAVAGADIGSAEIEIVEPQRIRVEDHTLGNALRYIIMKNPDVEFCGYSIPHPSEAKMNLRIQTWVNVYDVLEKGLNDLMDLCDVVVDKFTVSRDAFNASKTS
ncbi:unnamed protein product [Aureobasidium pullulans]|nr:unnamed protein product [Aureobasidium pullulans]